MIAQQGSRHACNEAIKAETAMRSGILQGIAQRQEEEATDHREQRSTDHQEGQEDKAKLEPDHLEEEAAGRRGDREEARSTTPTRAASESSSRF